MKNNHNRYRIDCIPIHPVIGVYALIAEDGRMYIGSSKNVRKRVIQHAQGINSGNGLRALNGHTFKCEILKSFESGTVTLRQLLEAEKQEIQKRNECDLLNERRKTISPYSYRKLDEPILEAQNKYIAKAYDRVNLVLRKDTSPTKDEVKAAADASGESLNEFIVGAIKRRMEYAHDPPSDQE